MLSKRWRNPNQKCATTQPPQQEAVRKRSGNALETLGPPLRASNPLRRGSVEQETLEQETLRKRWESPCAASNPLLAQQERASWFKHGTVRAGTLDINRHT